MKLAPGWTLMLSVVFSLLWSGVAQAQLTENDHEVRFEITNPKDARTAYQYLALPIQWGSEVTGKPHQYKLFTDHAKAVTIYCDPLNGNPRCFVNLAKIESTDMTEVAHDQTESRVTLYDSQDAEPLFNALLVKGIVHGGYEIRALTDEALNFSVSCMKDTSNGTGTSCQIMIFKGHSI